MWYNKNITNNLICMSQTLNEARMSSLSDKIDEKASALVVEEPKKTKKAKKTKVKKHDKK